jgi:hypothetical protein
MEEPKHQASTYLLRGILIEYNHELVKVRWKFDVQKLNTKHNMLK